jgi:multidrug efflux pump subunit AcrB
MMLAIVFVYFLMVMLLDSYLIPVVVLAAVPVGLIGVVLMLWATGTAINVQSLLGIIFMVGIVVSNTVLMVHLAERLRTSESLSALDAIRGAASIRAQPVIMTALAALFALLPMAVAWDRQRGQRTTRPRRGRWVGRGTGHDPVCRAGTVLVVADEMESDVNHVRAAPPGS